MQSKTPAISVIVPAYNAETFVEESLGYIKAQTFKDFECLIIDDGSTDETQTIIKRFIKKDPRFKLIVHEKNLGLSSARNTGLKKAVGDYVIFLDSDDIFKKGLLAETYSRAINTGAEIVLFNFNIYKQLKHEYTERAINFSNLPNKDLFAYSDVDDNKGFTRLFLLTTIACNKLFLRKFLNANNILFDSEQLRAEDLVFTASAFVLSRKVSFIDEVLFTYRTENANSNQGTINKYPLAFQDALLKLKKFFVEKNLEKKYAKDLNNFAIEYSLGHLIMDSNDGASRKYIIESMPNFLKKYGFKHEEKPNILESQKNYLPSLVSGNYDKYMEARVENLIGERDALLARIPPLEDRIKLELGELKKAREEIERLKNPSFEQLIKMLARKVLGKFSVIKLGKHE